MPYLLNILYLLLLVAASPWLIYAAVRHGKYREGFREKFLGLVPRREGSESCVWLHAVSVGEVNLLGVLIKELRGRRPNQAIVVSSTTRTGLELARKKYPDVTTFYCPLDFSWSVRAALRRVRPSLLVLAELELWPNLIGAAVDAGVKVAVVNGRLSEKSFRGYARIRPVMRRLLNKLSLVAVQNDEYRARFAALGCDDARLVTTGSLKFDGATGDRRNPATRRLADLAGFSDQDVVFLAGSTQEGEEQVALDAYRSLASDFPQLRLVLVPRHAERFEEVAKLCERSGLPYIRGSSLGRTDNSPRILLVDAIGELGAWWGTAHIAFVGGSFGDRGGQNMLEPAAYGAAVSFGPNTWNFREIAGALVAAGGAVVLPEPNSLVSFVRRCLTDAEFADELGRRARELVAANLGATARTVDLLLPLVAEPTGDRSRRPSSDIRRAA
ncbi:MAG: 3-deoxy-D-manno-octulosonic acid transferase [Planctomycetes bacterium]|nr:3-deoxy-D-manno-octulosonic acid transferase [Planctomycetota bacterium]